MSWTQRRAWAARHTRPSAPGGVQAQARGHGLPTSGPGLLLPSPCAPGCPAPPGAAGPAARPPGASAASVSPGEGGGMAAEGHRRPARHPPGHPLPHGLLQQLRQGEGGTLAKASGLGKVPGETTPAAWDPHGTPVSCRPPQAPSPGQGPGCECGPHTASPPGPHTPAGRRAPKYGRAGAEAALARPRSALPSPRHTGRTGTPAQPLLLGHTHPPGHTHGHCSALTPPAVYIYLLL